MDLGYPIGPHISDFLLPPINDNLVVELFLHVHLEDFSRVKYSLYILVLMTEIPREFWENFIRRVWMKLKLLGRCSNLGIHTTKSKAV